ncbi:hypothetical protein P3L10_020222 [Capsicum annuum]
MSQISRVLTGEEIIRKMAFEPVALIIHGVAGFSVMREFKHKSEPQFLGNWKYLTRFLNSHQILGLLRKWAFTSKRK